MRYLIILEIYSPLNVLILNYEIIFLDYLVDFLELCITLISCDRFYLIFCWL